MATITVKAFKCDRCGHVWLNRERSDDHPVSCARCKSPHWNRGKKIKKV